ncbi:POL3 protein, partial [Pseudoatta argentina]
MHRGINTVLYDQKIYKAVNIKEKTLVALIDPGSDLHLIKAEEYIKIGSPPLTGPAISCKSLSKDRISTLGSFSINVEVDGSSYYLTIHIISDIYMNHSLLLGSDLLSYAKIELTKGNAVISKHIDEVTDSSETHIPEIFSINVEETRCKVDSQRQIEIDNIEDSLVKHEIKDLIENYKPQKIKETIVIMNIVLKDEIPVYQRPRRLAPAERVQVSKQIDDWLRDGIIRPSISEYASPITLVGDTRLCVDYRQLNKKIIKDRYPLPLIDDQIDRLQDSLFFSTIDLKDGFFHVSLTQNSYIVENGSVRPSEHKTRVVINFPTPTNAKQVQSFLGLTGYFRKFIPAYSEIARPLSDLLKNDAMFRFDDEQKNAFQKLKTILSQEPLLKLYRVGADTELHTDASSYGFGAILCQRDDQDRLFHPVCYASWKTSEAESRYSSYELERCDGDLLLVIPKSMQVDIIKQTHERGHFGVRKTEQLLKREFWFSEMRKKIDKVIKNSEEVINRLSKQAVIFGNPCQIVSDRGTAFTSKSFKKYCADEKIEHILIATGVPRGNGQVERINRIVIPVLTKLSAPHPETWYKFVDRVQQYINSSMSRSTGLSPFELLIGKSMRLKDDLELKQIIEDETILLLQEKRETLREQAKIAIEKVQKENQRVYNLKRKRPNTYSIGDLVAIKRTQITPGSKLYPKYLGPYQIIHVLRGDRYVVSKVGEHEGPRSTTTSSDNIKRWLVNECDLNVDTSGEDTDNEDGHQGPMPLQNGRDVGPTENV